MRMTTATMHVLQGFLDSSEPLTGADFINEKKIFSGTLYPILARLKKVGWIEGAWEDGDPALLGRPRRRYYKLTAKGEIDAPKALADRERRSPFGVPKPVRTRMSLL